MLVLLSEVGAPAVQACCGCELFGQWFMVTGLVVLVGLNAQLRAFLAQSFFNDWNCQGLMNADSTGPTLKSTAAWFPAMLRRRPRSAALGDKLFLVLFRLLA